MALRYIHVSLDGKEQEVPVFFFLFFSPFSAQRKISVVSAFGGQEMRRRQLPGTEQAQGAGWIAAVVLEADAMLALHHTTSHKRHKQEEAVMVLAPGSSRMRYSQKLK